jgi:hypothetical protein
MSSVHDQQPIQRTVGRRRPRDGQPLTPEDREAMTRQAQYRTRAPKGVFIYYSAEEMQADRLRWTVDAMIDQMDAAVIAAALERIGGA